MREGGRKSKEEGERVSTGGNKVSRDLVGAAGRVAPLISLEPEGDAPGVVQLQKYWGLQGVACWKLVRIIMETRDNRNFRSVHA